VYPEETIAHNSGAAIPAVEYSGSVILFSLILRRDNDREFRPFARR
jgi:hypothetical protein